MVLLNDVCILFSGGFGYSTDVSQLTGGLYTSEFTGCLQDVQIRTDLPTVDFMDSEDGLNVHECDATR